VFCIVGFRPDEPMASFVVLQLLTNILLKKIYTNILQMDIHKILLLLEKSHTSADKHSADGVLSLNAPSPGSDSVSSPCQIKKKGPGDSYNPGPVYVWERDTPILRCCELFMFWALLMCHDVTRQSCAECDSRRTVVLKSNVFDRANTA
jgi:hypothetical protein